MQSPVVSRVEANERDIDGVLAISQVLEIMIQQKLKGSKQTQSLGF